MYTLLIVFFLLSIVFSFLCSLWEAVLLSVTPTYAQMQINAGSKIGKQLQSFKENIDRPLAGILTLNTIAHTVGAIGVGVQAANIWEESYPLVTSLVVPVAMTLAILILSEIIPKTIGATYWERFVPFTVWSLNLILFILYPLVLLSQLLTGVLKKNKGESVFSRSELLALAEIGAKSGAIEDSESKIIANLLRFQSIAVADIMTPRTVVKAASADMKIIDFFNQNKPIRFSRIPIFQKNSKDDIVGLVLKADIHAEIIHGHGDHPLESIKRGMLVVKSDLPIPDFFKTLLESREHIALVVDEFGGMAGIVTTEDVIETLLGLEIVDEFDKTEDMQALARKNWQKRAQALGITSES